MRLAEGSEASVPLTRPEDLKRKSAAGKAPLQLLQLYALVGAARVREYGDSKYEPGNWLNAEDVEETYARYAGAALRHMMDMQSYAGRFTGESCASTDLESELPHIDHAIMSLVMLRELLMKYDHLSEDPGQHLFTPHT